MWGNVIVTIRRQQCFQSSLEVTLFPEIVFGDNVSSCMAAFTTVLCCAVLCYCVMLLLCFCGVLCSSAEMPLALPCQCLLPISCRHNSPQLVEAAGSGGEVVKNAPVGNLTLIRSLCTTERLCILGMEVEYTVL